VFKFLIASVKTSMPILFDKANSVFTHWRQCACVHFPSAICDHKQREGCGRWVVGYCL